MKLIVVVLFFSLPFNHFILIKKGDECKNYTLLQKWTKREGICMKKSIKKVIAAVGILSMSMSFYGCSGGESSATSEPVAEEKNVAAEPATEAATEEVIEESAWAPDKEVKIRVPAGAGGAFDIAARIFGQSLQDTYGATIMVTNLTGASGGVAAADLVMYDPDPCEMMGGNIGMFTMAPLFNPDIALDMDDFEIVTSLISDEYVICTSPQNTGIDSWESLLAYAESNHVIASTAAPGDTTHALLTAVFGDAGIAHDIITNDAGNQRLVSTVAGDVALTIVPAPIAVQFVQEGTIMPILSFSEEATTLYEGMEVPTAKSLGYDYVFRTNNFIMVRKGADESALDQIFDTYVEWQETDAFKTMAEESQFIPYTFDGETTTAEIQAAADMFKEIFDTYYVN